MNWKLKALLQNIVSLLPEKIGCSVYYRIQRRYGGLQQSNPINAIKSGIAFVDRILSKGRVVAGKTFLEVGTGRKLNLPIVFWLCGAEKIFTVDVNPYLKLELIMEDITYIQHNKDKIIELFAVHSQSPLFAERFAKLLSWRGADLASFLSMINTTYIIQNDSSSNDLRSQLIDYHVSRCVFEHIPPTLLNQILLESHNLLRSDGLLLHQIDLSDHFSHSDSSISSINFLQYSEFVWRLLAGNRFMYQNRLRFDDFTKVFSEAGLRLVGQETEIDKKALKILETGFVVNKRFRGKSTSNNATTVIWIFAEIPPPAGVV